MNKFQTRLADRCHTYTTGLCKTIGLNNLDINPCLGNKFITASLSVLALKQLFTQFFYQKRRLRTQRSVLPTMIPASPELLLADSSIPLGEAQVNHRLVAAFPTQIFLAEWLKVGTSLKCNSFLDWGNVRRFSWSLLIWWGVDCNVLNCNIHFIYWYIYVICDFFLDNCYTVPDKQIQWNKSCCMAEDLGHMSFANNVPGWFTQSSKIFVLVYTCL